MLGEVPESPYLPEVPGRGARRRPWSGRTLARARRARRPTCSRPGGGSPTPRASTTGGRSRSLGQDLDRFEEQTQGFTGDRQGAGHRPVDPRRDRRAPARRPGARRPRRPARARAVAGRGAGRAPRATCAGGCRGATLRRAGRRAGAARRARRRGPHGVRLPPAPVGRRARGGAGAGVGARRRYATPGAEPVVHCCADDVPVRPARPGRRARASRRPRPAPTPEAYDEVAAALEAGRWVLLGVVPSTRPAAEPTASGRSPSGWSGSSTCSASSRRTGSCLTPACGLAGADPAWARTALTSVRRRPRDLG